VTVQMQWFANRGQVVQIVLAGLACIFAAINAWPSIEAAKLLAPGPILFYRF